MIQAPPGAIKAYLEPRLDLTDSGAQFRELSASKSRRGHKKGHEPPIRKHTQRHTYRAR